jgi:hypothetical protein
MRFALGAFQKIATRPVPEATDQALRSAVALLGPVKYPLPRQTFAATLGQFAAMRPGRNQISASSSASSTAAVRRSLL